jgi:hypothetical protein
MNKTNKMKTRMGENIPNLHTQMAVKYSKWPSEIYPNRDFWYENIPSGNPVLSINISVN